MHIGLIKIFDGSKYDNGLIKKNDSETDRNTADDFIYELIREMKVGNLTASNKSETSKNKITLQIKEENKEALDDTPHFSTDEQLN